MSNAAAGASQLVICQACGAAVDSSAKSCWLCQGAVGEEIIDAQVVGEPHDQARRFMATRIALIVAIVLLAVVTGGVFLVAPGIGVLLGIVFVIAAFAVAKDLQDRVPIPEQTAVAQAYSSPVGLESPVTSTSVGVQILKALGIIALIGLSSIISFGAFCAICIFAVSNM
jgi:hypothetical protein